MPYDAREYVLTSISIEANGISTLFLREKNGDTPRYRAGQVIDVYFPEIGIPLGKTYSISSKPGSETLSITVHAVGTCSRLLCGLQRGDSIHASLPYGSFYPRHDKPEIVMLAAGMGITSFRGMLYDLLLIQSSHRVSLFYSVRKTRDIIFQTDLEYLQEKKPNFKYRLFVTRDTPSLLPHFTSRRMQSQDIFAQVDDQNHTEFLICGSFSFIQGMQTHLFTHKIPRNSITTSCISTLTSVFQ